MEEIQMRDQQLHHLREKMQETLDGFHSSDRQALELDALSDYMGEYQIALDGLKIELKTLTRGTKEYQEYNAKTQSHKKAYKKLESDVQWLRSQNVTSNLMDGATESKVDYDDAQSLMQHGLDTQQATKESLQRTLGKVAESQVVGRETAVKLHNQTEQIEVIYDDLEDIETTLARSTKIIKRMARKMSTDKYLWVIIALVLIALVAVIVVAEVGGGSDNVNSP